MAQPAPPRQSVPTPMLYDLWASTYDTDENILQAIDDYHMRHELIRTFAEKIRAHPSGTGSQQLKILDLGCGTGRNTTKLLQYPWGLPVHFDGWDLSPAMLSVAREKSVGHMVQESPKKSTTVTAEFRVVEFGNVSDGQQVPLQSEASFDGILSSLVLEHLPLDRFFHTVTWLLKDGGHALVTNMHPDLGQRSQAGFKNTEGNRLIGTSYVHGIEETIAAAHKAGLELVEDVKQSTTGDIVPHLTWLNGETVTKEVASKWEGIGVWYGMLLIKKTHPSPHQDTTG